MSKFDKAKYEIEKRAGRSPRNYPLATLAYYGPDDTRASKVVLGYYDRPDHLVEMKKWFSDEDDLRFSPGVNQEILDYLNEHGIRVVATKDRLIGCPHEEGIDYPEGGVCPECPFWHGVDRWTGLPVN